MPNGISKCCTCGKEWQTGHDGSHSCSTELTRLLDLIRTLAFTNVGAKDHADADLALVQIHAIANEIHG